ncbi:MAG: sensor histidine kinase [Nitrospirae bacterium]|nr:sensor histidine kinase [Nitrospirota bacterium]
MTHLSDDTFEAFLPIILNRDTIDLREVAFIDPFGMVGLLETGRYFTLTRKKQTLLLPGSAELLKYLERMDFFKFAGRYFELVPEAPDLSGKYLRSAVTDVLLEITPIEKSDDIHYIVGKVKQRAQAILARHLHYNERAIDIFIVALSEVCQNILEHSENTGFVGIQKYFFQKQEKNVVKIAVMDPGLGFRKTISERIAVKNDLEAIEKALLHGVSRYEDAGRGHGLAAVRRFVREWNGKISIRSGTAKLSIIPDWARGREKEINLTYFPGAQINIMLPEV